MTPLKRKKLEYLEARHGVLSTKELRQLILDNTTILNQLQPLDVAGAHFLRLQGQFLTYLQLRTLECDDGDTTHRFAVPHLFALSKGHEVKEESALCWLDLYGKRPMDGLIMAQLYNLYIDKYPEASPQHMEIVLL